MTRIAWVTSARIEVELVDWLYANAEPILRFRVARDLLEFDSRALHPLCRAAVDTPDAQRWLENLNAARAVHGSTDLHAENALAKLLEFGLDRSTPEFDAGIRRLLERPWRMWDALVLRCFLLRCGYADHPFVSAWAKERIETLWRTASAGDFDLYLTDEEAGGVPKAWRGKPVYRPQFGHEAGYAIPICYDLLAISCLMHVPGVDDLPRKLEAMVGYLSDPRFQETVGGFGWARDLGRCYAAGRVFLACAEPNRLILFLEWAAPFAAARQSDWFQRGLSLLETYRMEVGFYQFPAGMLPEKAGYQVYGGAHMGLGESRRGDLGLRLESTFRMLWIRKRMGR